MLCREITGLEQFLTFCAMVPFERLVKIRTPYLLTYLLTPRSTVLFEKLIVSQSRNSLHFMEPEGSLPHSQVPATCHCPQPARSSPYPLILLPEDPS